MLFLHRYPERVLLPPKRTCTLTRPERRSPLIWNRHILISSCWTWKLLSKLVIVLFLYLSIFQRRQFMIKTVNCNLRPLWIFQYFVKLGFNNFIIWANGYCWEVDAPDWIVCFGNSCNGWRCSVLFIDRSNDKNAQYYHTND